MDDQSLRTAGADEAGEKQGQSAQVPATSGQDTDVTVIPDDEAAGERGKDQAQQKRIMPQKRPNLDVRAEFDLETNGDGKTEAKCKHCKEIVTTAKTVNTSRLRTHLVSVCQKAPGDIKERAYNSGQGAKKAKKTLALMPSNGKTLSEETLSDVRAGVSVSTPATPGTVQKKDDIKPSRTWTQAKITDGARVFTKQEAIHIQRADVEAVVARFESLQRFDDPFVQAAALKKEPGLAPFLITARYAQDEIVPQIDRDTQEEMDRLTQDVPGDTSYSVDGVTVNGKSHQLTTKTTALVTRFVGLHQLGSEVHVSEEEVKTVVEIVKEDIRRSNDKRNVCSISVDNAASSMADALGLALMEGGYSKKVVVTRDPSHCADLGPKDLVHDKFLSPVIDKAKDLIRFLNIDRIAHLYISIHNKYDLSSSRFKRSLPMNVLYMLFGKPQKIFVHHPIATHSQYPFTMFVCTAPELQLHMIYRFC